VAQYNLRTLIPLLSAWFVRATFGDAVVVEAYSTRRATYGLWSLQLLMTMTPNEEILMRHMANGTVDNGEINTKRWKRATILTL
jgi:hypothetical protein